MWNALADVSEFNAELSVHLVDKLWLKLDAIFCNNLETACNRNKVNGYLNTFPDFLNCLIKGTKHPLVGPCKVDLNRPGVTQLRGMVSKVINIVNEVACPFMKKMVQRMEMGCHHLQSRWIHQMICASSLFLSANNDHSRTDKT